jgi:hypothetical protein
MGADSAGVGGRDYVIRKDPKVFIKNQMLFGFTTSFRMGQLIQNSLKIPEHSVNVDDFTYLTSTFIDAVLECFREKAFAKIENNTAHGGQFLLGYRGSIYEVETDFQVGIPSLPYEACGCGADYAKGAMHILLPTKMTPKDKIVKALETASAFSNGVFPPYRVLCLPGDKRNS